MHIPVVLLIKLYVTPQRKGVSKAALRKENVPAVHSYEIVDYLLSFMELLLYKLITSYRQIVKIEVQKFYSDRPRTTFKFMRWEHYVIYKNQNPDNAKAESRAQTRKKRRIQPKCTRDEPSKTICRIGDEEPQPVLADGTVISDRALSSALSLETELKRKNRIEWFTAPGSAGRGQSREIPKRQPERGGLE